MPAKGKIKRTVTRNASVTRRGQSAQAERHLGPILEQARNGNAQMLVEVTPAVAATLVANGATEQAHAVLTEVLELPGACEDTGLIRQLKEGSLLAQSRAVRDPSGPSG